MYRKGEESGFFWHWQNLKKEDHVRGKLLYGRGWIHHRKSRVVLGADWSIPTTHLHGYIEFNGGDHQIMVSFACGLFALWVHIDGSRLLARLPVMKPYYPRKIGWSLFHWSFSWDIWNDDTGWAPRVPRWQHGYFAIPDFLFGRNAYTKVAFKPIPTVIPMPEGDYPATVTFFTQTWKRPRLPWPKSQTGADVDIEGGIPIPGKGENSWDCDEDAYMSIGTSAGTVEEAVQDATTRVNKRRERYGGKNWQPETAAKGER